MSRSTTRPTIWSVRPAKTPISLGIRPDWSESLLSAWRNIGSSSTHWVHCKDSDQTRWMPRLIWVYAGRTNHFAGFVMRRLKWSFWLCVWHSEEKNATLLTKISVTDFSISHTKIIIIYIIIKKYIYNEYKNKKLIIYFIKHKFYEIRELHEVIYFYIAN